MSSRSKTVSKSSRIQSYKPTQTKSQRSQGFNGGAYNAFLTMSKEISKNIDDDYSRGLIAVWHDESHLNEYVTRLENLENLKIMTPSYCFAQSYHPNEVGYPPKIVALDKNHAEVRS